MKHEKTNLKSCSYSAQSFFQYCQPAQNQPKSQFMFCKIANPRLMNNDFDVAYTYVNRFKKVLLGKQICRYLPTFDLTYLMYFSKCVASQFSVFSHV